MRGRPLRSPDHLSPPTSCSSHDWPVQEAIWRAYLPSLSLPGRKSPEGLSLGALQACEDSQRLGGLCYGVPKWSKGAGSQENRARQGCELGMWLERG